MNSFTEEQIRTVYNEWTKRHLDNPKESAESATRENFEAAADHLIQLLNEKYPHGDNA